MKKLSFHLVALGLSALCVCFYFWLRQRNDNQGASNRPPTADITATPSASEVSLGGAAGAIFDAHTRELLAALQRLLAHTDARAREALLAFKDDAALKRFLERADKAGLTILGRVDSLRAVRVRHGGLSGLQRELVENAADYTDISANHRLSVPRVPMKEDRALLDQVPFRNDALPFLGATGDRSDWGRGVTIAVLDTGIGTDRTFGDGRVRSIDIGLGLRPGSGTEDGHGTAVAALAGGRSPDAPGVAPAANLLSIRVTDAEGVSDIFTLSQAIVAAVDAGANIVNISLGGHGTGPILDAALGYAQQKGAVVVAAAGNDQAAQLAWPAADPRAISVGAVDKAEQQVVFSNAGDQLQLTAPGYGVQSAWLGDTRVYFDGTSASAPLVSGALAAVLSQNPSLTGRQAAELLVRTASDGGAPGADAAFGRGILNVGWAMNSGSPGYVDTAVSSHYLDAANNQMQMVVQNRSSQTVSGMSLAVNAGDKAATYSVPSLAPGESHVARVPVDQAALRATGRLSFTAQLINPPGLVDRQPANNRKTSVLTATGKP